MTNEDAMLLIATFWLLSGRGVNLCFVIFCYYAVYIFSTSLPSQIITIERESQVYSHYILQSVIDSTVMATTLFVSIKYQKSLIIYCGYAAIIASSLLCEIGMLLDQSFDSNMLKYIHAARQSYSIPLDLLFAAIGSAAGERLLAYVFLLTCGRSSYNRFYRD